MKASERQKQDAMVRTWRRLGFVGIVFFTIKGLLWLLLPVVLVSVM